MADIVVPLLQNLAGDGGGELCAYDPAAVLLDGGIGPLVAMENGEFAVQPFFQLIHHLRGILVFGVIFQFIGQQIGVIRALFLQNIHRQAMKHPDAQGQDHGNTAGQQPSYNIAYLLADAPGFSFCRFSGGDRKVIHEKFLQFHQFHWFKAKGLLGIY